MMLLSKQQDNKEFLLSTESNDTPTYQKVTYILWPFTMHHKPVLSCIYATYSFSTSSPAPQKCASLSIPSTEITVLSTSKHTAEASRHRRFASSASDFTTGILKVDWLHYG